MKSKNSNTATNSDILESEGHAPKDKKRNEFILIILLALIVIIGFVFMKYQQQKNAFTVEVSVDGTTISSYGLDDEVDTWIEGYQGGQNHLVIHDGFAKIDEADCPDKLCVKQGEISKSGETVVCLPHRVVVTVK